MCYYVNRLRSEVEKKDGRSSLRHLVAGWPGQATIFATRDILCTLLYSSPRCKNILRTETLSKHHSIFSLPPCCSFTEVILLRPRNDAASRSGEERSYDRQLVDCNCTLSYCKRTVAYAIRRLHRAKMKKIASTHSTQGDAAQDDLKDKKDGQLSC